jgi:hypothetical protein
VAHPLVANGEDDLQIQGIATNILNKQLWTIKKGGPPAWELCRALITLPPTKKIFEYYKM